MSAELLDRLPLRGDERVLDAGCGTGALLAALVERLPEGRAVGVDLDPVAVDAARRALAPLVELHVQDLLDLAIDPVDAIVSTATFHLIPDHDRLFARLAGALRAGGRLEAECPGEGNVASVRAAVDRVRRRAPWDLPFEGWDDGWTFAGPADTERRLAAAGFAGASCTLVPRTVRPEDDHAFLRVAVLGRHLERLPEDAHDDFVEAVRAELDGGSGVELDYVRLVIAAVRDEDGRPGESPAAIARRLRDA